MGIKETPTSVKTYYKLMIAYACDKISTITGRIANLEELNNKRYNSVASNIQTYLDKFDLDISKYEEFNTKKYIDGKFLKVCNGAYLNRGNDYELVSDLYELLVYARTQRDIHELEVELEKYTKISKLTLKEYTEILRIYYTEVHKQLILEGNGYVFGNQIGWICINRCLVKTGKKLLDYTATKKKEKELKEQGKRIWDKEEAEWCKRNNIEYIAEDKRIFKNDEYCYEIPLLDSKLPNGSKLRLKISDYRHSSVRGKTNEELIKECNNNTNDICNLQVDLKTKLTLCDKTDKSLYIKFIRNENQTSVAFSKTNRKNR